MIKGNFECNNISMRWVFFEIAKEFFFFVAIENWNNNSSSVSEYHD